MFITVAICTWNRAKLLDQTLRELANVRIPGGVDWEILVVNNNSTDNTEAVVAQHSRNLPIRSLFEARQGHSHARNCAVNAARGDFLVWTDDDVLPAGDWLVEYVKAVEAFPDAGFFAGPVRPWYEKQPPKWIRRHIERLAGPFPVADHGPEWRPLHAGEGFYGANMAVRTTIAREFMFNCNLGRVGDQLTGGDDTDFARRLRDAGVGCQWIGTASVRHFVPADRLCVGFVRRWFEGAGRTEVRQRGAQACPRLFGWPRWALYKYARTQLVAWSLSAVKSRRWFDAFRQAAIMRGFLAEEKKWRCALGQLPKVESSTVI
jgi:glycosyltransferase involved in cell wall biosynthesis